MSRLFDVAIQRARERPHDEQDELALGLMLQMAEGPTDLRLSDEQVAEVRATMARLESGEEDIVPVEEMAAFWRRCGL